MAWCPALCRARLREWADQAIEQSTYRALDWWLLPFKCVARVAWRIPPKGSWTSSCVAGGCVGLCFVAPLYWLLALVMVPLLPVLLVVTVLCHPKSFVGACLVCVDVGAQALCGRAAAVAARVRGACGGRAGAGAARREATKEE